MHDSLPQSSLGFLARFLYRLGAFIARKKWVFLVVWLLAFVGAIGVLRLVGSNTSNNVRLPGTNSQKATDLLAAKFPPQQNGANPVLFYSKSGKVTAKKNKQAIQTSYKALKKLPHVYSVTSPFSQQGQAQVSKDKKTAFISVLLSVGSSNLTDEIAQSVVNAAAPGKAAGMQVAVGGPLDRSFRSPARRAAK